MAHVMDAMIQLDVGPTPTGPATELRASAAAHRLRLERRLDLPSCFTDRPRYRALLERLWGVFAAFEDGRAPRLLEEALTDFDLRRKAPLIARDLRVLSRTADPLSGLERCSTLPRCEDTSSALGCLYVLESATLGGRALLPLAERRLGLDAEFGAAYLAGYGSRASRMSGRLAAALDAWCVTPERLDRAATAASGICSAIGDWLIDRTDNYRQSPGIPTARRSDC